MGHHFVYDAAMPYKKIEHKRANQRAHHAANAVTRRAQIQACKDRIKLAAKQFVYEYLLKHPCVDCGERDPIVLEFDHRPDTEKSFSISDITSYNFSMARIIAEIEKCDVRCANCHRRITYFRAGRTHRHADK